MIAARFSDGSAPPEFYLPTSTDRYQWQLTAGCSAAGGVFLNWRNVTPFGIADAADVPRRPAARADQQRLREGLQ